MSPDMKLLLAGITGLSVAMCALLYVMEWAVPIIERVAG